MNGKWHWLVMVCSLAYIAKSSNYPLVIFFALLLFLFLKRLQPLFVLFLVFFFAVSYLYLVPKPFELAWNDENVLFRGKIVEPPKETNQTIQLVIQPDNSPLYIQAIHFKNEESISYRHISPGMSCEFTGELQEIQRATNPGQFDYQAYIQKDNIYAQIVLQSPYLEHCRESGLLTNLYALRNKMMGYISVHASETSSAWQLALLFGERSNIPEDVTRLFQEWGLSHLLAISGLHVGLLAACFYFVCIYVLRFSYEKTTVILLVFFSFYPLLSGGAPSVWRASLFYVSLLFLALLNKKWSFTDLLSLVFLLMIFINPLTIEKIAFQFSFIVTYTILLSRKILKGMSVQWASLVISLISMLAILPIQLYHFYQVQPLSVLVNFLAIPYFSIFVMPVMLILMITSFIYPIHSLIDFLFVQVHESFISVLLMVDEKLSDPWVIGQFPLEYFIFYYLFFFYMMKKWELNQLKISFLYGILITTLLLLVSIFPYWKEEDNITMLDIGQGDSIVIETSKRQGVFIMDAGGTYSYVDGQPSDRVFKQVIDPYLKSRGITFINGIFLTHEDMDHIGSVPFLLEHYNVGMIYTHPYFDKDILKRLKSLSPQTGIEFLKAGETYTIDGFTFTVLHPEKDYKDTNENSLVLYTNFNQIQGMLTGDIGVESEKYIVSKIKPLEIDFLKTAHHGSNTSTGDIFLERVQPKVALISVGANNRYGHPHEDVLERLKRNSTTILRTDKHGAITIKISGRSGTISTYLPYDEVKTGKQ